jgi:hypothetical protein
MAKCVFAAVEAVEVDRKLNIQGQVSGWKSDTPGAKIGRLIVHILQTNRDYL